MSIPAPWYDDDAFWNAIGPAVFDDTQWQAAPKEVEQVVALVKPPPGGKILDLCCGPGRHSLELARRGFKVTGVDRTASFLEEAKRRAVADKLDVEFVREDMRKFVRPGAYDAILNLFSSFAYFDDPVEDRLVLFNALESLRPGGVFIVDTMAKEVLARSFIERDWSERGGLLRLEERKIVRDWMAVESRWVIVRGQERREVRFTMRLYSASELSGALKDVGFRHVEAFGDLSGSPYDHLAKRLVVVARK